VNRITVNHVLSWGPCWLDEEGGEDRVRATLAPLGESFTALDVLRLEEVTHTDRLWVALQDGALSAEELRLFAVDRARDQIRRKLAAHALPPDYPIAVEISGAIDAAERDAKGSASFWDLIAARNTLNAADYIGINMILVSLARCTVTDDARHGAARLISHTPGGQNVEHVAALVALLQPAEVSP